MAVLRSGILGRASGKVAGIVGAHWKDRSYVREYVIPSNPNTTLQQVRRLAMRGVVATGKPLVGQIFNKYVDKFQKSMSGFNWFVKENIAGFVGEPDFLAFKLSAGPLYPATPLGAQYNVNKITITWQGNAYGNNGRPDDKVFACAFYGGSGVWYFAAAEVARYAGTIDVAMPTGLNVTYMFPYLIAAKYSLTSPTLLEMISNSASHAVVMP
jgi:hypothetical protein